ncbi:MAG: ABC transporter ATP-binding protein [Myxococcota bacterium]|jgi:ABC-2 type transport system ATP-binding protein|nr:ABC transporter ATP-binding protein [Myxococcota bacterium]
MAVVRAEQASKYYGAFAAVRDLTFSIEAGEVVGLLGLNGAGKTTTLKLCSGLLSATSGMVEIAGNNLHRNPAQICQQIGFSPEHPPLYSEMPVADFIRFVARIKGVEEKLNHAVDEALELTDLKEAKFESIGTLSHGYRRRVGIAQAIVHRPQVILLDEPTSGLDPVQVVHMRELVKELKTRHTILLSSHILHEIHQACDRILVLEKGTIVAQGREEELAERMQTSLRLGLEVRGEQALVEEILERFSWLRKISIQPRVGFVHAEVELLEDKRELLVRALVESGLGLRRFEPMDLELENIFLSLTGHRNAQKSEKPS